MNRILLAFLIVAGTVSAQSIPVPPVYQDLYDTLNTQITSFDSTVKASGNGSTYPVVYAPQLLSAASDQFTLLLKTDYYTSNVLPELEEQQALGAKAVTVHICFPILYEPFYASNPTQYQQFVSFYQQLASDIHGRGMRMIVENVTMSTFPGNMADSFTSYDESLTWSEYMTGRAQNVVNVAQLVGPDYMSVITEPDSEADNSGQVNAGTVTGSTQLLQTILTALQAAGSTNVAIGAGAGTWINSFNQYIENFAATSVQFVDMHIYPVNNDDFLNALTAASLIHAAGKEIGISEAWDYKVRNSELGKLSYTQIYARDPFSFWGPVDISFLRALIDFGNAQKLTFISPYWSHYYFAYLDFNMDGSMSDSDVLTTSDQATADAISVGSFTPTGIAWMNSTIPTFDKTPPAEPSAVYTTAVFPNTIQLAWAPTTDNIGVAAYNLYRNGVLIGPTSQLTYNDQNLVAGETYTYTLNAFDASGNISALSPPLTVQTTDTTPPSVPTGLQAVSITPTSVSLTWNASTGVGGVAGYRVLRGTTLSNMTIRSNPTTTSYIDPYVSPSTTYFYSVESFNPLGISSAPSPALQVTTPAQLTTLISN